MAIIYSYPNLPLSELNSVDTFTINGTNANGEIVTSTVSLSNLATYITNTGTGSGTTNTLTLWSDGPSGVLGDSILTQDVGATALTVTGNFISTGTGDFTGQVTIPATPVAATDAASKNYVDTEVAGIPAGLVFKGNWNANTNSPALASGTGTVGNYYVVSVAGNTDLDGITDWQVGDWAVFVEVGGVDKWDKIDQTFVSGSGASGQVTFWNTINTVNGDNDFYWDNTNKRLGIGTTAPLGKLQVNEYIVGSQGDQTIHGELSVFANNGDESLFLGVKDSNFPNRGWAFNPVSTGVNSDLQIKEHGQTAVRMTFQSGGNVGIGTTNPGRKLVVSGAANGIIQSNDTAGTGSFLRILADVASENLINWQKDTALRFCTSGENFGNFTEHMRIDSAGNVGIGIASPNALGFLEKVLNVSAGSSSSTTLHQAGITISGSSDANDSDDFAYLSFTNHQSTLSADRVAEIRVKKVGTDVDTGEFTFYTANGTSLAEVLTLDSSQNATFAGDVLLEDNKILRLGSTTGGDFNLGFDGSNGFASNLKGDLYIQNFANDKDIIFRCDDGSGGVTEYFQLNGFAVRTDVLQNFRVQDNIKFQAGSSGDLNIFHDSANSYLENKVGNLIIRQEANDGDIIFKSDDGSGGDTEYFRLDGGQEVNVFSKNIKLEDGVKALFGGGNDLQIYHDGSDSYIKDSGTGDLRIDTSKLRIRNAGGTESIIIATENGSVDLYYNDSKKFETKSTGVGVEGSIDLTFGTEITGIISTSTELMEFRVGDGISVSDPKQLKIDINGIEVTGDVEVTNSSDGLILKSPNGTRYRVTVDNSGNLSTAAL